MGYQEYEDAVMSAKSSRDLNQILDHLDNLASRWLRNYLYRHYKINYDNVLHRFVIHVWNQDIYPVPLDDIKNDVLNATSLIH